MLDPQRLSDAMDCIRIQNNASYEPNRTPPTLWFVVDESKAEPEVNYPGDLISTHGSKAEAKIGRAQAIIRASAEWFSVLVRPPEKKLLMVTGDSGYATHRQFLELAYYDNEYRPEIDGQIRWLNVQNDQLLDKGWRPSHWAHPIYLPPPGLPADLQREQPRAERKK